MKPEDLKYNSTHEWVGTVEEKGEKIAVIGITDFAIQQLTDLVYMALPTIGKKISRGQEFGEVESVKAVSPLYSPIDGEVVAVHSELADKLETLGADPYGSGWIIKAKLAPGAGFDGLLDFAAYKKQCSEEH